MLKTKTEQYWSKYAIATYFIEAFWEKQEKRDSINKWLLTLAVFNEIRKLILFVNGYSTAGIEMFNEESSLKTGFSDVAAEERKKSH